MEREMDEQEERVRTGGEVEGGIRDTAKPTSPTVINLALHTTNGQTTHILLSLSTA